MDESRDIKRVEKKRTKQLLRLIQSFRVVGKSHRQTKADTIEVELSPIEQPQANSRPRNLKAKKHTAAITDNLESCQVRTRTLECLKQQTRATQQH
jgi:hypothetical protein